MKQNFRMVDVGEKSITRRRAVATGSIHVCKETMEFLKAGDSPKGNILAMAEVAGIMAAKNTASVLPLCHPLLLDRVRIWFDVKSEEVHAFCEVICSGKTGVEMEALNGVNACLLTIYDLAKAIDPVISIRNIYLERKEGGKSGLWIHPDSMNKNASSSSCAGQKFNLDGLRFAVVTLSDRASQGVYEDKSGTLLRDRLAGGGGIEIFYSIIPDEKAMLRALVTRAVEERVDVLVLTGGTGLSERDITPDVLTAMADKELIGFGELQRHSGSAHTKSAWLSRASAFVVSKVLVVLLPGSPKAVVQGMDCLGDLIPHAVRMIRGEDHH